MHKVTDQEVDFILNEIRARGVTIEDLQYNLLDHMCCIIEVEMSETEDFNSFFKRLLPRFFDNELKELQDEAELLLTFKHFYAMKKTLNITGLLSTFFMFAGVILKVGHWPGAGASIVLGITIFSLLFLPLMIILKVKDDTSRTDKLVLSLGFAVGIIASLGFLAKLMHWPYATLFMLSGVCGFTFLYVPLYFFTRIRRPDLKFNTTMNTVLMFAMGSLLFALFNLKPSLESEKDTQAAFDYANEQVDLLSKTTSSVNAELNISEINQLVEKIKGEIITANLKNRGAKNTSPTNYAGIDDEHVAFIPLSMKNLENLKKEVESLNKQLIAKDKKELCVDMQHLDIFEKGSKVAISNLTTLQLQLQIIKLKA